MNLAAEWLEADGLGGFASGTVSGIRTRRYHALLLPATNPPAGRMVLVNGFEAWVTTPEGTFPITSQCYAPDVVHPDGSTRIVAFTTEPWPTWHFRLRDGLVLVQELFVPRGTATTVVSWRLESPCEGATLHVRPLLSGRDYHALHHENPAFRFDPVVAGAQLTWHPYEGVPGVTILSNGAFDARPDWYRSFLYREERERGLDHVEDLATPGVLSFDLAAGEAVCTFAAAVGADGLPFGADADPVAWARLQRTRERRRRSRFASRLHRSADDYLVQRGNGRTVIAGYPWFTDWGRDTFIALRGLCLATGRLEDARSILRSWAGMVSDGMLPNRFPDHGGEPEYNSVDASLWYVVAVHDFLAAWRQGGRVLPARDLRALREAVLAIVAGYARGTRFGIRMDDDGLLSAGVPGVQLTWMDAKVGDWVVTPRIGKPVEVQALWINALRIAGAWEPRWLAVAGRAQAAFAQRFWNEATGCLCDVVDVDHVPGRVDGVLRPNQVLAVGGLPYPVLVGERARAVIEAVERTLLTPLGPRSLAAHAPGYAPRYVGNVHQRDGAYHQGTVWPWLLGAFVEGWVRVRGGGPVAIDLARQRFLPPLMAHLEEAGLGHLSEIADAEPPHTPRGCPFQAWSLGETLRLLHVVLAAVPHPTVQPLETAC